MCDKQCATCECAKGGFITENTAVLHSREQYMTPDMIDMVYSPERAKVVKEQKRKNPFMQTLYMPHLNTIDNYAQKGVTVSHINDYSPEKQAEWEAIQPYDKNAYKGLETLAPQRKVSAFKDAVKDNFANDKW